jgi:hypothetical protein
MQFKYPELLYALLLLIIPILVHLFQLRRFQKVPFTNVQFLKQVILQTRKSSRLKKWLVLCTRLLLLAAIIMAFAQPFWSAKDSGSAEQETVIWLDDSFSMQAKGEKGELMRRAVQDLIEGLPEDEEITLFTNTHTYRNISKKGLSNALLELNYNPFQLDYNAAILKGKALFSPDQASRKQLILLSDFQQQEKDMRIDADSLVNLNLVQVRPVNTNNISIDSLYISGASPSSLELTVLLGQQGDAFDDIPVSLYNNDQLIVKTTVNRSNGYKGLLSLPNYGEILGKITIEDGQLAFDNTLYFNINERPKVKVLSINAASDNYLKRLFGNDEFSYISTDLDQLNYNDINTQNLIILNELDMLPVALINALTSYADDGGTILCIPSNNITINTYNQLYTNFGSIKIDSLNTREKKLTGINFDHPVFQDVFDASVSNFQYPKVNSHYDMSLVSSPILSFEDGRPFFLQIGRLFLFTAPLNVDNSNFINSPLIVPTLYNVGQQSLQLPKLYYILGKENKFDVNTTMLQDDILKIGVNGSEIIPQQRTFSSKVTITTSDSPHIANTYAITSKSEVLEHVSYNYDRAESRLSYMDLSPLTNATVGNSIPQVLNTIKSNSNVNELWKWFVIFAATLLIIEMLILKYLK